MALDRNIAPVIKDAIDFDIKLKPYQHFVLDNQVEVYTYEGGAEQVMLMDMVFFAGNSYEDKNWVAAATNFLLKKEIKNLKGNKIKKFYKIKIKESITVK